MNRFILYKSISLAESRPVHGDKGFVIGHPFDLWSQTGAWQVSAASSGYLGDQLDDRGDILKVVERVECQVDQFLILMES